MSVRTDYAAELRTRVTRAIREGTQLSEPIAAAIADMVLEFFWHELSGERVYFGKRSTHVRQLVRAEYNGKNADALQRKYRISRSTLFRYVGR